MLVARGTTGQVFLQIRAFVHTPEFFNVGYSDVAESRVPLLVEKEGHHAVVVRITVMGPVRIVVRETLMNAAIMRGGFDINRRGSKSWTGTGSWHQSWSGARTRSGAWFESGSWPWSKARAGISARHYSQSLSGPQATSWSGIYK